MKRFAGVAMGMVLLIISVAGVVAGVRAGVAQGLYFQAKYGSARDNPDRIFALCENAYRLYPFNYNFCILAAETAYHTSFNVDRNEAARRRALAERWCSIGLRLNFHRSELRLLKTRLLAPDHLSDAIRYWEAYVDWQFWAPDNHAVLVELYSLSGDFDKALQSLEWVKGTPAYAEANRKLHDAWKQETSSRTPSGSRL